MSARKKQIRMIESQLSEDILFGADVIAEFLFGPGADRRRVYRLTEKACFPTFKLGGVLCARRSKIMAWIERQEAAR